MGTAVNPLGSNLINLGTITRTDNIDKKLTTISIINNIWNEFYYYVNGVNINDYGKTGLTNYSVKVNLPYKNFWIGIKKINHFGEGKYPLKPLTVKNFLFDLKFGIPIKLK
jgi:hypothetical protein